MIARQRGGARSLARFHERTDAGENAENVRARRAASQITASGFENEIHFVRWRQVQVRAMNADHMALEKALDGLDALEEDIVKKQRAAAQPVEHKYELMPL